MMDEKNVLPERLQKEWKNVCGYYSKKSDMELWNEFKETWDINSDVVKEIIEVPEIVNKLWKDWRVKKGYYDKIDNLSLNWNLFKKEWDIYSDGSKKMFEEMSKLSDGLYREWYFKYNYTYVHVYESRWPQKVDYNKTKLQLWEEFKEIWELDMDNYDEEEYKRMLSGIEDDEYDYQAWYNYRENANYHSYDSYSVREQYEIWCDFVNSGCKDPYKNDSDYDSDY